MPKKQIKPYIEEISLAFNPANMKKFILMKEGVMPNLVEILTSKDALLKEKEVNAVLDPLVKEMKLSQEAADGIKGVLRVLNAYKDGIPKSILSTLAKAVPEYAEFANPEENAEEHKARMDKAVDAAVKEAKDKFLKEEKAKIEAQVKKDLEAQMKKEGGVEALQAEVQGLKKEVADSKKEAEKAKDDSRLIELKALVKEIGVPGDVNTQAKTIFSLEKMNPDLAKEHIEGLKKTATMLKAAGLLSEVGSSGPGTSKDAYEKLMKKVDELKKDGKLTDTEAFTKAVRDNPELYKEYRNERGEA